LEKNDLPEGWIGTPFDSIAEIKNGFAFKSTTYQKSGIPLVRISNIQDQKIDLEKNCVFLPQKMLESNNEFKIYQNDILIALSGATTGKYGIFKKDTNALLNQRVGLIRSRNTQLASQTYFLYYFGTLQQLILKKASGMAQPNISTSFLKQLEIPLPPPNEQKRIVKKIEELFSKIDNTRIIIKNIEIQLTHYQKSLLKSAFRGELTEIWRQKGKTETKRKLMVNLPNGWEWKKIGDICTGIVPGRYKPKIFDGNIPWITTPDLDGKYIEKSKKNLCVSNEEVTRVNMKIMPKGTVLITCVGDLGRVCITKNDVVPNQQFHGFICSEKILPEYLMYALKIQTPQMISKSTATTISYMNKTTCNNLKIPLTQSIDEQKEIILKINYGFLLIENTEKIINLILLHLNTLQTVILKQAFDGKLVPQDPNDEPASELLKRIKN